MRRERAEQLGLAAIVDGFNADDLRDHRPGHQAAREHAIRSPLSEAGLTKDEIRAHSRALGLRPGTSRRCPASPRASRTGRTVTPERLEQIGSAESDLRAAGLRNFRVRYHGDVARLEVAAEEQHRFADPAFREHIEPRALRARGFVYVALDLEPFRSGRLNEAVGLPSAGAHT